MSAIADLAKLLEQIPLWKRLTELPKRIEALVTRALLAGGAAVVLLLVAMVPGPRRD